MEPGGGCVIDAADLMAIDFDDDISLVEKEQTILLKRSSKILLDRTIMPPQDQAPVKDADLEQRPMNLKEGDRYVLNHGEGLMVVDFDGGDATMDGAIDRSEGQRENHYRLGVGKVPLLVGADAIVVVHEKDDLMQKDASVKKSYHSVGKIISKSHLLSVGTSRSSSLSRESDGVIAPVNGEERTWEAPPRDMCLVTIIMIADEVRSYIDRTRSHGGVEMMVPAVVKPNTAFDCQNYLIFFFSLYSEIYFSLTVSATLMVMYCSDL
ncbi:hypothetical protein BHE74_00029875 [Ensete ventricosum]|nr:hypothetical protein GW17_00008760 [Ensete ventricosum]RWW62973.1 hypothetical protein BHE74_00029875 [Ensete ventricosum]RZR98123.1 hypothetical protein BHM03_00027434 [Ensete ventricosum]